MNFFSKELLVGWCRLGTPDLSLIPQRSYAHEIDGFVVVVLQIGELVQMLSGCWQGSKENVLSLLSAMTSSNSHGNLMIFKLAVYTSWLAFLIVFLVAVNNLTSTLSIWRNS